MLFYLLLLIILPQLFTGISEKITQSHAIIKNPKNATASKLN
jgi:hypothetical protein